MNYFKTLLPTFQTFQQIFVRHFNKYLKCFYPKNKSFMAISCFLTGKIAPKLTTMHVVVLVFFVSFKKGVKCKEKASMRNFIQLLSVQF